MLMEIAAATETVPSEVELSGAVVEPVPVPELVLEAVWVFASSICLWVSSLTPLSSAVPDSPSSPSAPLALASASVLLAAIPSARTETPPDVEVTLRSNEAETLFSAMVKPKDAPIAASSPSASPLAMVLVSLS